MSINIWEDNWVRNGEAFCPLTAPYPTPLPTKVCELFCEGGRRWDGTILNSLFNPHLCSLICSTPISWTGCADKLIWSHSSSGVYSVNSGYLLASCLTKDHGGSLPSSSYNLPPTIWKLIWRLKVPPRVKHFLWRALRNALATKENLFSRKCARNPLCDYCGTEVESIEHIFFRCEWTNEVWGNCGIIFPDRIRSIVSLKQWILSLHSAFGSSFFEKLGIIAQLCWAIWKQRNDRIFSNTHPDPIRLIRQALRVHGEFLAAAYSKANVPERTIEDRNDQTWQRPPNDRWKFNCDGAYNPSDKSAAFAVLVRNSDGAVVDINHGRIKVSSALAAEAWAVRIAVAMAVAWGKKEAIIESDCKVLVDLLQPDHANTNWTIQAIIDDIVSLSVNANFVFSWCNRKVNSCAHWIASNSRIGLLSFISPCNIPSKLCSLIRMDI